jgi:hypothetical protein
MPAGDILI